MNIFLTFCILFCFLQASLSIKCRVGSFESCLGAENREIVVSYGCTKCGIQDTLVYKNDTPTVRREFTCNTESVVTYETDRNKTSYRCETDACNFEWPHSINDGTSVRASLCSIVHGIQNRAVVQKQDAYESPPPTMSITLPPLSMFLGRSSRTNVRRSDLLVKAKLAERVKQFDDMAHFMKQAIELDNYRREPSREEYNLLFRAFKMAALSRVAAWKLLNASHTVSPKSRESPEVDYANQIKGEFLEIGSTFFDLINKIHSHAHPESVDAEYIFWKLTGRFYEIYDEMGITFDKPGSSGEKLTGAHQAGRAYRWLLDVALRNAPYSDPKRLEMVVSLSTLYAERMNETERACLTAEPAYEDAIASLFLNNKDPDPETEEALQVLRDKLAAWKCNPEEFRTVPTLQPQQKSSHMQFNITNSYSCRCQCGELEEETRRADSSPSTTVSSRPFVTTTRNTLTNSEKVLNEDDAQITTTTTTVSLALSFLSSALPLPDNRNVLMRDAIKAEKAERFDEFALYAKKLTELSEYLSEKEENLVWRAFEKAVEVRRALRKLPFGNLTSEQAASRRQIPEEILKISDVVNRFWKKMRIVPGRWQDSLRSLFLMRKSAEFLGYVAELGGGIDRIRHAHRAESRYNEALQFAKEHSVSASHPMVLGIVSTFSNFLHNIRGDQEKACTIARNGYERSKTDFARTTELQNAKTVVLMKTIEARMEEWTCSVGFEKKDQTMLNSSSNITTIPAETPTNVNSTSESAT